MGRVVWVVTARWHHESAKPSRDDDEIRVELPSCPNADEAVAATKEAARLESVRRSGTADCRVYDVNVYSERAVITRIHHYFPGLQTKGKTP